jgi:hypothetical protein
MLKRLIVEFSDELSALGVTVDSFDARLGQLETDIGGWHLAGQFRFDLKWTKNSNSAADILQKSPAGVYGVSGKSDFDLNRYRLFLEKRIDEKTSFFAQIDRDGETSGHSNDQTALHFAYFEIRTKIAYDIAMTVGRTNFDWEADLGFIEPNAWESWIGDLDLQAFKFKKDWGMANLELVIGRVDDDAALNLDYDLTAAPITVTDDPAHEYYLVSALANFDINEKFRAGAMGYYYWSDYKPAKKSDNGYTAGIYAGFKFHPSVELKGIYYFQSGDGEKFDDDSSNAWKAIIEVDQDLLKFTSLWLEYGQIDNNFTMDHWNADFYRAGAEKSLGIDDDRGRLSGNDKNTTSLFLVNAQQKWNDKWSTFLRYAHWDFDSNKDDTLNEITAGVKYQFTDAMSFELSYDAFDADTKWDAGAGKAYDKDHIIRFRTLVNF